MGKNNQKSKKYKKGQKMIKLTNPRLLDEHIVLLFRQGLIDPEYIALELSSSEYMLPFAFVDNKTIDKTALVDHIKYVLSKFESKTLVENFHKSKLIFPENNHGYIIYDEKTDKVLSRLSEKAVKEMIRGENFKQKVVYGNFEGYNPKVNKRFFEEDGRQYFNVYEPPSWKLENWYHNTPIPDNPVPEIYMTFFKHLTDNRENDINYVLDWLAISLQKRNFTYLVTVGAQGVGKGVAGKIMRLLHGESNYIELAANSLKKQFNKQLKNRTLVYFNEAINMAGEVAEKIKLLNEERTEIELKGIDSEMMKNYANYYFSSNNYDAFKIDDGNRRFSFIDLTKKSFDFNTQDGDKLIDPKNIKLLANHLYNRKYDVKWETTVYRSETTSIIAGSGRKDWEIYMEEDFFSKYKGSIISLKDVVAHLKNRLYRVQWSDVRIFILNNKSKFHLNSKSSPKDATLFYDYNKKELTKNKAVLDTSAETTSTVILSNEST